MYQKRLEPLSINDYLEKEYQGNTRHEYLDGYLYTMAGAGEKHNLIALNLATMLRQKARGTDCRPFISDMKLYIASLNRFYYPDIVMTCDPDDDHEYYKEKPCLIIEVLSPSTETTDRREKLHAYQSIPSVKEYILVSQEKPELELYRREKDHWQYFLLNEPSDLLRLECLNTDIPMPVVFEDVFEL